MILSRRPAEALDALGVAAPPRTRPSGGVNDALPWTPPLGVRSSQLTTALIRTYQDNLRNLGILTAPASGTLDAATRAAVEEFQTWWNSGASNIPSPNRSRDLVTQGRNRLGALTVDGDLGPRTQQALSLLWRWPLEPWAATTTTTTTAPRTTTTPAQPSTAQQVGATVRDAAERYNAANISFGQSALGALGSAGEWLGDAAYGAANPSDTSRLTPAPVRVGTAPAATPHTGTTPGTTTTTPRAGTTPAATPRAGAGQLATVPPQQPAAGGWTTSEKWLVGGAGALALLTVGLAASKGKRGRR